MTADKEDSAARLNVNGKKLTLPMVEGTDGEGAIDVSRLRAETGLVAFDPGYGNTAEARSSITCSTVRRGAPLPRLPHRPACRAVQLPRGGLPAVVRRSAHSRRPRRVGGLDHPAHLLRGYEIPLRGVSPRCPSMQVLASAVSALAYYPDALDPDEGARSERQKAHRQSITMSAWAYKYSVHQPYVYPETTSTTPPTSWR